MTLPPTAITAEEAELRLHAEETAWLDRLGVPDHGVHPDVPKNVSKSMTVD